MVFGSTELRRRAAPALFLTLLLGLCSARAFAEQALVTGLGGVTFSSAPFSQVEPSTGPAPKLELDETSYDFGRAKEGDQIVHKFGFKNAGGADLVIGKLRTTCGCTAALASTGPYRPGERGVIEVRYDSRAKVGYALKEVEVLSNDPRPPQTLTIEGIVLGEKHPQFTTADVLFSGSCAQCHAEPAKDRKGKELYDSVCAICHDLPPQTSQGRKWVAPDRKALAKLSREKLKKTISQGLKEQSMPGFGRAAGGPLTDGQIDSLADYLISLKK